MQLSTLLGASFVAAASAALPPINLGYLSYPHGNLFVAWSPFTPTTTQEITDVCDTRGAVKGTATWTTIRAYNTYVFKPICRNPFNVTDAVTNTTYYNLELACVDDNIPLYANPEVTAVVDTKTNKTVETCVPVSLNGQSTYGACSDHFSGVSYSFACSA
ncbi:hypothetical protein BDP55DRAFT_660812 [Colletotrichum godetiae]|uniref:Uncharacterized protein n=1 Tax=Colletotrichum godetiae TaxID=1209918 RepID=A0AAJ0EV20_9PEZI|nr:uncharacterized protein BDP55DRAFT_660812 [Colletotrichum godetiae]KAK1676807.1 hypothetical protein BDP55DRAFT_660812 [Colletotrichum godetiae]